MKVAPDPVMSEVVRQRLEALLAEVQPRHALPAAEEQGREPLPIDDPGGDGEAVLDRVASGHSPARAAPGAGIAARATVLGRRTVDFTREHLAAVVVVLLVGCGWTAYSLLQARSTPVAVAAVPTVIASASASASATPTTTQRVLVHVLGAVRSPGVVELPQGARVADAIEIAGGLSAAADPGELNLAAVVVDGSQVVIGTKGKPRGEVRGEGADAGARSPGRTATVSLNSATLEQLDTLPGVGPVTAQRILDWRKLHGRFSAVTELQEVDGIGPKTYADIAPNVRV
ncbi:MAG TPA: helix-hairpin-helix domain-containing protein [Propionicimonas sp.]